VSYLYKYPLKGVHDYLCNELYKLADDEVEFYLVQLCHLLLHKKFESDSLERFILDKCAASIHFALQISWILQAFVEDGPPNCVSRIERLREDCEIATVNCRRPTVLQSYFISSVLPDAVPDALKHHRTKSASCIEQVKKNDDHSTGASPSTRTCHGTYCNTTDRDEDTGDAESSSPSHQKAATLRGRNSRSLEGSEDEKEKEHTSYTPCTGRRSVGPSCVVTVVPPAAASSAPDEASSSAAPPSNKEAAMSSQPSTAVAASLQQLSLQYVQQHCEELAGESNAMHTLTFALSKKDRCDYFNNVLSFVQELSNISDRLKLVPQLQRQDALVLEIEKLNEDLPVGLYLPIFRATHTHHCIVRISSRDAKCLTSREKVPYILYFEVLESVDKTCSSSNLHEVAITYAPLMEEVKRSLQAGQPAQNATTTEAMPPPEVGEEDADVGDADKRLHTKPSASDAPGDISCVGVLEDPKPPEVTIDNLFGELWASKKERIRRSSPYGSIPNWNLASVIVKNGDDCRQEQLAVQLITQFQKVFQQANLPLFLRPYHILVTSSTSGLIEVLSDAISLHQLKKNMPFTSLVEYFEKVYGPKNSPEFIYARRNFVESVAAYSIVTYLLQVKDRHNGNIMIDAEGHIIHIDFGFMLSTSPGSLNFESAPFKLTQEFVDVMDGVGSDVFQYFKALMIRGFMEARKYSEKIILLVEMMASGSKLACFQNTGVIEGLRDRFNVSLTEEQCNEFVENLIYHSLDNWRTRHYDRYQYLTGGILY